MLRWLCVCGLCWGWLSPVVADVPMVAVDAQPLASNAARVAEALESLGRPFPPEVRAELDRAGQARDALKIQQLLDAQAMFVVSINPEGRVKVARGEAPARLQQGGFTPVLIKVLNDGDVTAPLEINSPQAGAPFAGVSEGSLQRQQQTSLNDRENADKRTDRFLQTEMFRDNPLTDRLSGSRVEYALGLIYTSEAGRREAVIQFDTGQGTQDLGFRAEVAILFEIRPAVRVSLGLWDERDRPTVARLEFRDARGHVYPPQARRTAPDFPFQKQIYREHGDALLLPPGRFFMTASRGPEYRALSRVIEIPEAAETSLSVKLQRWFDAEAFGYYSGDHHIHAAGCAHYDFPTRGVSPYDMFLQVKGEGLNVGCVLTWGPCFDFQRQFFSPQVDALSDPKTLIKYDLEISGFGSAALGHVCLLNLRDQTYPGSEGTSTQGWPTWTLPVLEWAKSQGGVTGYAHSASGMHVLPEQAIEWILRTYDSDRNGVLSPQESSAAVLPARFEQVDADGNGSLSREELIRATDAAADRLPNLAIPAMNGAGALELPVTVAHGACDFISAMDTARIPEWNTWYHVLNCGFPLKVSGETDFPCMSSTRVGQGRVYVHLGPVDKLDFGQWCDALAQGRSYVSDGFAHAPVFTVNAVPPGYGDVSLKAPGKVTVVAEVAFAPTTPLTVAQGLVLPETGRRTLGDTVQWNQTPTDEVATGGERLVEIVVNGEAVVAERVTADGNSHRLTFEIDVRESSWIALRQFPQLHTNPVNVLIGGRPVRASADSARWCAETIRVLWNNRERNIAPAERAAARQAYDEAIEIYRKIEREAAERRAP